MTTGFPPSMRREEEKRYRELLDILSREWEALRRQDVSSMMELLPMKTRCAAEIRDLAGRRESFRRPGEDGRKEIDALRLRVRQANRRNQEFIEQTLHFVQEVLSIFLSPESPFYSSTGKSKAEPSAPSRVSRKV